MRFPFFQVRRDVYGMTTTAALNARLRPGERIGQ
jgi:hypothetical protein